jgi:chitinase
MTNHQLAFSNAEIDSMLTYLHTKNTYDCKKYGFWEFNDDYPITYTPNWDGLTHVVYISWGQDGNGTLKNDGTLDFPPDADHYNDVKTLVHAQGKKLLICISARNSITIDNLLANTQEASSTAISNLITTWGADGANFDFEYMLLTNSITGTSNKTLMAQFIQKINTKTKAANADNLVTIFVDSGAGSEVVWHTPFIDQYVDQVLVGAYDYAMPWVATTTGPNCPILDTTRFDIVDTIDKISKFYMLSKCVMCLPFYGYHYTGAASGDPGATFSSYTSLTSITATISAGTHGRLWDSASNSPYVAYQDTGVWHQIWYDDKESLKIKRNYILSRGFAGIGYWYLGAEDSSLWDAFI